MSICVVINERLIETNVDGNVYVQFPYSIRCKEHPQSSVLNCSDSSIKNIVSLRFEKPMLSLICRIRRALKLVTLKILLCILSRLTQFAGMNSILQRLKLSLCLIKFSISW